MKPCLLLKYITFAATITVVIVSSSCKQTHSKTLEVPQQQAADSVTEISLLFMGDVMQHGPQIRAAYNDSTKEYDYSSCFAPIAPIASAVDFSIANLELTLAGEPYSGYPQFSAPDALANAMQSAGIRYLVTANNHSCDRGKNGIIRTVQVLDSLGIPRTGTFKDEADRKKHNILWLEKNGIKVAVLNYTYGTNGIPVPAPTIVNLLDSVVMKEDIKAVKKLNPDKIIIVTHWGDEYQPLPNAYQKNYADICLRYGADYVIGSHPHVLQPMHRKYDSTLKRENIVVYSLGNFVSNQRERYKDGGAMFKLVLQKKEKTTTLKECGYFLTWVDKKEVNGKNSYAIYPVSQYENDSITLDKQALKQLQLFRDDSHELFEKHSTNVKEYVFDGEKKKWLLK